MLLNLMNVALILLFLAAFVFIIYKKAKNKSWMGLKKSHHILMIDEGISLGVGQRLSIVKIDKEYFGITYGQNGVAFQKLASDNIENQKLLWEEQMIDQSYSEALSELEGVVGDEK